MDVLDRIFAQARIAPSGCWEFTGPHDNDGYGSVTVAGRTVKVHRVVYERLVGPIPPGQVTRHHCDNPACFRPECLIPGTQAENIADRDARGRTARGERNGRAKLTATAVAEIRQLSTNGQPINKAVLARRYGVTRRAITFVLEGITWKETPTTHAGSTSATR